MSNVVFPVTIKRDGPDRPAKAKVFYVTESELGDVIPKSSGGSVFFVGAAKKKVEAYESVIDFKTAQNEGSTANVYTGGNAGSVTAAGTAIGTATDLTKYLNTITAATVTAQDGVQLPSPATRKVVVVKNSATTPVKVFPHTASAFVEDGASGASYSVAVGARAHFYTDGTGDTAIWKVANDFGV